MHQSIAISNCEFINVEPLNPLISKCQIKVCYVGQDPNRNGSIITKEVATQMANSLPGSPIVGYFNEHSKDFEGHNRIIDISNGQFIIKDTTQPYGFVDLNAKCWFQWFQDDGEVNREYLVTEGYLWTGQYEEARRIMEHGNNQSMELDDETLKGEWTKDEKGFLEFFIINEAVISKLCILGEDVEPCFEGANITKMHFSLEKGLEQKLFSMLNELKEYLKEGGIENMSEEILKTSVEDEQEFAEKEKVCPKCGKPVNECTCEEEKTEFKKKSKEDEDEGTDDKTAEKEPESKESEESKESDSKEEKSEEESNEDKEEKSEEDDKKKDKKKKFNLDEIPEYIELKNNYEVLQQRANALEAEIQPLREFKAAAEKKEKQNMIDSFYMLNDEDKADVIANIDTYSLEDIEAKLSIICVRNKVSFGEDTKESPTVYNLGNFEDTGDEVPAWVRAALNVAEKN